MFDRFSLNEIKNAFRIRSETDFEMARNSFDSFGLNSNPKPSPRRAINAKMTNYLFNF